MTSDYINKEDIKRLKYLIQQVEIDYDTYMSDEEEDFEIDYEDLKKEIFNIQCEIKAISEKWAE